MEKMTNKLYELDENEKPYLMIFNNYALNTQYVVEVLQRSFSQSQDQNMLWYYNLEMKAIAPASAVKDKGAQDKQFWQIVSSKAIAKAVSGVLTDVSRSFMQF